MTCKTSAVAVCRASASSSSVVFSSSFLLRFVLVGSCLVPLSSALVELASKVGNDLLRIG